MADGTASKAMIDTAGDRIAPLGAGDVAADTNLSIGVKRAAEMAAVFMIGDGMLGLLQATRHVELWRSDVGIVDALVAPFGGRPGRRRLYGLAQMAAGIALAAAAARRR